MTSKACLFSWSSKRRKQRMWGRRSWWARCYLRDLRRRAGTRAFSL